MNLIRPQLLITQRVTKNLLGIHQKYIPMSLVVDKLIEAQGELMKHPIRYLALVITIRKPQSIERLRYPWTITDGKGMESPRAIGRHDLGVVVENDLAVWAELVA